MGLVFAPTLSQIKVTLVVCLTFVLRGFLLCISLQRNHNFFSNLKHPRDFFFVIYAPKVNQTMSNFLIWHHIKESVHMFESGRSNTWCLDLWRLMWVILICAQELKVSDMWRKYEALLTSPLQGKLCEMQFLIVKMRDKVLCCPLCREGLFPEEAILVTSANPLHTPLLRM